MTYPTQLSEKVTPQRLDTMYNNFVKMTDWLLKGKQSQHPMPAPYEALFNVAELVQGQQATITEQDNLIGGLQQRLAQQDGRIAALETTLQSVNATLVQLVELANAQAQQASQPVAPQPAPAAQVQAQPAPTPAPTPTPVAVTEELADLGVVTQAAPAQQAPPAPVAQQPAAVSPNEPAIQVSAAAVGAGNIDPASYAALDAEIGALLSK